VIWRYRIDDITLVLDELDRIASSCVGLAGRVDHTRIAVAGHSWGATTVSALLGARIRDNAGQPGEAMIDSRVTTGVLLPVAGTGGDDLTPFAAERFAFMNPDFDAMTTPALGVAGDADRSPLSTRGPDWWTDAYRLSPPGKTLLTLFGAEHSMGGIAGYSTHETTDWSPERIALVQQVTTAYLRGALYDEPKALAAAGDALAAAPDPQGRLESR
jgi:pimeloyl-ACP methyl ester carboxylesterase